MPPSRYCAAACAGSASRTAASIDGAVERRAAQRDDAPVDPDRGGRAGDEQQIAGAPRHQLAQPGIEPGAIAAARRAVAVAGDRRRRTAFRDRRLVVQLAEQGFEILRFVHGSPTIVTARWRLSAGSRFAL